MQTFNTVIGASVGVAVGAAVVTTVFSVAAVVGVCTLDVHAARNSATNSNKLKVRFIKTISGRSFMGHLVHKGISVIAKAHPQIGLVPLRGYPSLSNCF